MFSAQAHVFFAEMHVFFVEMHMSRSWQHRGSSTRASPSPQVPCSPCSPLQSPAVPCSPLQSLAAMQMHLEIFTKDLNDPTYIIEITFEGDCDAVTVKGLKQMVSKNTGIPVECQAFILTPYNLWGDGGDTSKDFQVVDDTWLLKDLKPGGAHRLVPYRSSVGIENFFGFYFNVYALAVQVHPPPHESRRSEFLRSWAYEPPAVPKRAPATPPPKRSHSQMSMQSVHSSPPSPPSPPSGTRLRLPPIAADAADAAAAETSDAADAAAAESAPSDATAGSAWEVLTRDGWTPMRKRPARTTKQTESMASGSGETPRTLPVADTQPDTAADCMEGEGVMVEAMEVVELEEAESMQPAEPEGEPTSATEPGARWETATESNEEPDGEVIGENEQSGDGEVIGEEQDDEGELIGPNEQDDEGEHMGEDEQTGEIE